MVWKTLAGLFGRKAAHDIDVHPGNGSTLEEVLDELREYIVRDLRGGYVENDVIVEGALEVVDLAHHDPALLRAHAQGMLGQEIAAYRRDSAQWPDITDHDRLERAFAALEAQGIVCRQHFTCCGTCGVAEIADEMRGASGQGTAVRGYTFFHMQDTESAIDGQGLYLNYGASGDTEAAALAVARNVVDALHQAGLETQWDGDCSKRILVNLQWQRRLAL